MQALILAYETEADFKRRTPAELDAYMAPWFAYSGELEKTGKLRGGQALMEPGTATCITMKGGARRVEDGPFPDSKEQLGGFFLVEVDTLDEAVRLAEGCPAAKTGFVDVRIIPDYGQGA